MHLKTKPGQSPIFLGIECGGTHSSTLAAHADGKKVFQFTAGPANLRLLNDDQLAKHFADICRAHNGLPELAGLAIGMAGARTEEDRNRIRKAAWQSWPNVPCYATNDLETALTAATVTGEKPVTRVLVISGTGSCCFGKNVRGETAKLGGWGHILGDKGSGYEIGLRALKATVYYFDRDGKLSYLGQRILRSLQFNHPNDLISWVQNAQKNDVAGLALEVFHAWKKNDKIAKDILAAAAASLAQDAVDCARRLTKTKSPIQFILSGSILLKQPKFGALVGKHILQQWPKATIAPLKREGVWGAIELAKKHSNEAREISEKPTSRTRGLTQKASPVEAAFAQSPTEERNPLSKNLDQLPLSEAIALMVSEDQKVPIAISEEAKNIEETIKFIVKAFKQGGRLFYAGAGTSGRLGVLDASECPPTFRTPPEMVQGIIAGGQTAIWKAVEGAEDDTIAGEEAMSFNDVSARDVVVGIAASGRTPFVWGALLEAKRRGAKTVLLCFNPHLKLVTGNRPHLIIAPNVGPEVLTGSTRLKAGTATKLILNILTTLAMVRIGKVKSNLMIDLNPSNVKLRDRAVRIVQELASVDSAAAHAALEKSRWVVKDACQILR